MIRRLLLPLLVAVGAGAAFAPSALAAPPPCNPAQPQVLSSAHFTITFNDDPVNAATAGPAITSARAGTALAVAEQAYAAFAALGYPAPIAFAGRTRIHVADLSAVKLSSYNCPGDINVDVTALGDAYSVAFGVFEEIEFSYGGIAGWLMQGAASWAAWKSLGYPEASTSLLGPYDMSLDCDYSSLTAQTCSTDGYTNLGLSRWPFYEYLDERFGNGFISSLLTAVQAAGGDGLAGLQNALAAKGTDLTSAYGAYTTKLLAAGWTAQQLNLAALPVTGSPIRTGTATADLAAQTFGVDHLGTRFVQVDRGSATPPTHCYAATLTLKVVLPAGVTSQPVFYWAQAGNAPLPLAVNGSSATITVPWDTCNWRLHGYLSLPNTSTTVNAALFTVSGHLDVLTTEVTSTNPAVPSNTYGPGTDVGSAQIAPALSVFGPLLLRIPAAATRLELIVGASAQGSIRGMLGSLDLGQQALVPGTNVVRFALPKGVLQRLRTSSASGGVLTLLPTSADGKATGAPVALKYAVIPAAKARPRPKKHSK